MLLVFTHNHTKIPAKREKNPFQPVLNLIFIFFDQVTNVISKQYQHYARENKVSRLMPECSLLDKKREYITIMCARFLSSGRRSLRTTT